MNLDKVREQLLQRQQMLEARADKTARDASHRDEAVSADFAEQASERENDDVYAPSVSKPAMKFSRLVRLCSALKMAITVNAVAVVPILAPNACRRCLTQRFALNVQLRRNNSAYKKPAAVFYSGFFMRRYFDYS